MTKDTIGENPNVLRARLELTAVRDRDLDRQIAAHCLAVDQEILQRIEHPERSP
jgi:hypothetical protein